MSVLEHDIEELVIAWATDRGWLCPKLQWVGQTGWPDRAFLKDGRVVWIEFKRPKGRRRAKQVYWLEQLNKRGFEAYFCDNVEEAKRILSKYE